MPFVTNKVLARIGDALGQRLVELDPARAEYLAPIRGRTIEVVIRLGSGDVPRAYGAEDALDLRFFVSAEYDRFALSETFDAQPDARISGSVAQLMRLASGPRSPQAVRESGLTIDGNIDTVQQFADVAEQLDIDFEALAARYMGDFPARKLSQAFKSMHHFVTGTLDAFAEDQGYYLREDSGLLVSDEEVDSFVRDVDALRADSERLSQRINRLRQQIGSGTQASD